MDGSGIIRALAEELGREQLRRDHEALRKDLLKEHILSFEDREALREHLRTQHGVYRPNDDHVYLDRAHIALHERKPR